MFLRPHENEWDTRYDKFVAWGSWLNAVLYAVPAAIILGVCWYTEVAEAFWIPVLIIYFIGAVAHLLNFGMMSLNIQIKISTDRAMEQMTLLMMTLKEK